MSSPEDGPRQGSLEWHLQRLEAIVAELENEDLELDESLARFEEGVEELREARRLLTEAGLRVDRLLDSLDGSVRVEPLQDEAL